MGSYDIIIYSDSETYTRTVKDLLEQQEAENGFFLSVVARLNDAPFGATPFMAQVKSGSVYQKIGYKPLSDWRNYRFRY